MKGRTRDGWEDGRMGGRTVKEKEGRRGQECFFIHEDSTVKLDTAREKVGGRGTQDPRLGQCCRMTPLG